MGGGSEQMNGQSKGAGGYGGPAWQNGGRGYNNSPLNSIFNIASGYGGYQPSWQGGAGGGAGYHGPDGYAGRFYDQMRGGGGGFTPPQGGFRVDGSDEGGWNWAHGQSPFNQFNQHRVTQPGSPPPVGGSTELVQRLQHEQGLNGQGQPMLNGSRFTPGQASSAASPGFIAGNGGPADWRSKMF